VIGAVVEVQHFRAQAGALVQKQQPRAALVHLLLSAHVLEARNDCPPSPRGSVFSLRTRDDARRAW
jgi:hypothetical protein